MSVPSTKKLPWTKEHDTRYSMLYTKYLKTNPDADRNTYIIDNANPRKLLSFIENSDYSIGTKKYLFFMVGRYLQIFKNRYYMKYLQAGTDLRTEIDQDETRNQKDEKELEYSLSHNQLLEIVEKLKPSYTEMSYKEHMQYLILCMSTLEAPLRTDFYVSAKMIKTKKQDDGESNYVFINHKTKQIQYIINTDKVSSTKFYKMNPKYKFIDIEDSFLKDLLFYSYAQYPRKFLLQREQNDESITAQTYRAWLRKVTESKLINQDMMRSAYVTWYYNKYASMGKREELAHKMRHSYMSAHSYYYKDEQIQTAVTPSNVNDVANDNQRLTQQLEDVKANCEEKKITKKAYTKNRYDVVYNLNHKGTKPRDTTMKKYNIKYDEKSKSYF